MTNAQGTVWETDILNRARPYRLTGYRYPKRAQKHEPDLYLDHLASPHTTGDTRTIGVLMWKRLTGKKNGKPRTPDGERRVVVMEFEDFLALLSSSTSDYHVEVQAKWTQALNVTRVLGGLRSWMKGAENGKASEDTGL